MTNDEGKIFETFFSSNGSTFDDIFSFFCDSINQSFVSAPKKTMEQEREKEKKFCKLIVENEHLIDSCSTKKSRRKIIQCCKMMFQDRKYTNISENVNDASHKVIDKFLPIKKHSVNSYFEFLLSAFDTQRNEKVLVYFTTLQRAGLNEIKDFRDIVLNQNASHCILISQDPISNSAIKDLRINSTIDYILRRKHEEREFLLRRDFVTSAMIDEDFLESKLTETEEKVSDSRYAQWIRCYPRKDWFDELCQLQPQSLTNTNVVYNLHKSSLEDEKARMCLCVNFCFNDKSMQDQSDERRIGWQNKFAPFIRRLKNEIERLNMFLDNNPVDTVLFVFPDMGWIFERNFLINCPSINFETFTVDEMSWPVSRIKIQPQFHIIESYEELKKWANIYGFVKNKGEPDVSKMHKIFTNDKIVRNYNLPEGTPLLIIRKQGTVDPTTSFSIVSLPKKY